MLKLIGKGAQAARGAITRRDFLQVGTLGAVGLSLPQYLAARTAGAVAPERDDRACILIFNLGAPSQLDLFDMKPDAPAEIRGPFRPMATASPEIELSELLPGHARVAGKFSLIRSCFHSAEAVHDTGHQWVQTGRHAPASSGIVHPHVGAVVDYLHGPRGGMPAHVLLPGPMGNTGGGMLCRQSAGYLGEAYAPLRLENVLGEVQPGAGQRLRDAAEDRLGAFEARQRQADTAVTDPAVEAAFEQLSTRAAREAFDLTLEPAAARERYGKTRFGQCCLLARRLVEAGVQFVTVNTFLTVFNEPSWDIHGSSPFTTMSEMARQVCPMYDQAYSALIEDLSQRGLLDRTLVCNLAEFGRTPRLNAAGGRDHWPQCWTSYFAGGGVQGGRVIGLSDALGAAPADRPVSPGEIVATIYHSLGINPGAMLPGPDGTRLPAVEAGTEPVWELF